ncbi:hypothetical protein RIF23_18705 [Lipingzhangella sp. LS1_29]|uniref:Uncharacterized protein n=1 Tax=Lipingzhangella rawalii TaxID=2055835 RepID=A0ABU2HAJ3_9ACTN|nr:hypothetical protein [Lipingzhangella rawalii]MDS1272322.1 hypothetical protein [Lipingzhangella rawalii]
MRRPRWRGWLRAAVLVALLLGVGSMHTPGHLHGAAHGHTAHGTAALTAPAAPPGAGPSLPAMDPTSMCLAIGTFAIALLGLTAVAFTR